MQRYMLLILLVTLAAALPGIACLPGPGGTGARPQADLFYHTGEDNQHWYGTTRWAVFFDVADEYSYVNNVRMQVNSALVYFPTSIEAGAATLGLYADNANHQPGTQLSAVTLGAVSPGWLEVDFAEAVTDSCLWLVLDCPTAEAGPWVSASADDGTHSWWWDPNYGSNGWFRNMAACSYQCEFLFGLNGLFVFPGTVRDIELVDVSLVNTMVPGANFRFNYTVRNNASVAYNNADLTFAITFPSSTGENPRTETIQNIELDSLETVTGTHTFGDRSPNYPCQFSLHANITGEDSTGISSNNSADLVFDDFVGDVGDWLVENFVRASWSQLGDWWAEEDILPDTAFIVNCFPSIADSLFYRTASVWRYNYHGLMGYPACVVANGKTMLGYTGAFADSLAAAVEFARAQRGFIQLTAVADTTWSNGDHELTFKFANPETHVFSSYLTNLRFHLVVVEQNLEVGDIDIPGGVLLQRLSSESGAGIANLAYGSSTSLTCHFNPGAFQTVDPDPDPNNVILLWWIQHSDTERILYAGHMSLADLEDIAVSVREDLARHPDVRLGPNPFSLAHPLTVSLSRSDVPDAMGVDVYNIRGQRVRKLQGQVSVTWDGCDEHARTCGSGVYLLRVSVRNGSRVQQTWKRCLLVK